MLFSVESKYVRSDNILEYRDATVIDGKRNKAVAHLPWNKGSVVASLKCFSSRSFPNDAFNGYDFSEIYLSKPSGKAKAKKKEENQSMNDHTINSGASVDSNFTFGFNSFTLSLDAESNENRPDTSPNAQYSEPVFNAIVGPIKETIKNQNV